jgi:hypothetical protein
VSTAHLAVADPGRTGWRTWRSPWPASSPAPGSSSDPFCEPGTAARPGDDRRGPDHRAHRRERTRRDPALRHRGALRGGHRRPRVRGRADHRGHSHRPRRTRFDQGVGHHIRRCRRRDRRGHRHLSGPGRGLPRGRCGLPRVAGCVPGRPGRRTHRGGGRLPGSAEPPRRSSPHTAAARPRSSCSPRPPSRRATSRTSVVLSRTSRSCQLAASTSGRSRTGSPLERVRWAWAARSSDQRPSMVRTPPCPSVPVGRWRR